MPDMKQGGAKAGFGWAMAWGILLIVLGALAILVPVLASVWAAMTVGWLILLGGAIQGVHAIQTRFSRGFFWKAIVAFLYLVAGFWLLAKPLAAVLSLTLALAIVLIVGGVAGMVMAFQVRPARGWGWHLFDALISILLGAFILARWPFDAPWVLGTYFGISLFIKGFATSSFACAAKKVAQRG